MKRSIGCGVLIVFLLVACKSLPQRPTTHGPATQIPTPDTVDGLAAAIAADSQRSDHESDAKVRGDLAADAIRNAEACVAREPKSAPCLYGRAVALGLEAKAHPTRAGELLKNMLADLAGAESADPGYDHAGPARVRALVLIRAPGWPLGPGDPDEGLVAARRAVMLQPQHPPNFLALAEALSKTGDANGARENYSRARDAAQALPSSPDRDDWLREADKGLRH